MMEYVIKRDGGEVTVWNEASGVGIRFTEGERDQRYAAVVVFAGWKRLRALDVDDFAVSVKELSAYCREFWPLEFSVRD